ncbi:cell division protein ZapB [Streptomyces geranii]|uniref:cell division protein ZapB n=1 Tax=Streptomyces geranii TaxID=2058923 RepID=UPI000D043698|nr:cell division protein ZapB [Streptomyces geranii]
MPRGRHRHSPPLHRLLPPAAIAGVSLVCALGPWVFTDTGLLRVIAAFAAAITVVGAAVMRRWDMEAGKQVADLVRARASDDWRHEERIAELESDLEESRELRVKLEQKLRAKRTELQGLRNEHAALLRRYATAETERASALEGRRLLELEASVPDQGTDADADVDADTDVDADVEVKAASGTGTGSARALTSGSGESADTSDSDAAALDAAAAGVSAALGAVVSGDTDETDDDEKIPAAPTIFSPEGSSLFLRARAALARFDGDAPVKTAPAPADAAKAVTVPAIPEATDGPGADKAAKAGKAGKTEAVREENEAKGKPEAARGHTRAAVTPAEAKPAKPASGTGHFTVPTAVAVVPTSAPLRRPGAEGGFDFFGTQKESASAALESVQNEDLADVVGQEALALHKAESEDRFKPADEQSRGIGSGQVIDLTAHDETEHIDMQGLRSAVS